MRVRPGRDEDGVVAPSRVILIVIVLIAIAGATWIAGLAPDENDAAATTSSRVRTSDSASSSASGSPSGSPSASPSVSPSASASSKAASPSAAASATAKATTAAPVKRGQVSVSVFNNSSRSGLAGRTAGEAEKVGWRVTGSGNWYGTIATSTVYFPASLKAPASLLAKDLGITRLKPAVKPMRTDRLTVIVTADYRG